jgi:gamma-glutamyltranspeptidase/glutathione hydrolase
MGRHGAVSAGHPLAAATALGVLLDGGNAVDAAVAGSAVQCVVEMPWCGIGGDAFALVTRPGDGVVSFNGSGRAPARILERATSKKLPRFGVLSVAVPGVVDAWCELTARFGTRPLEVLLAPAQRYAAQGVPVDARLDRAFAHLPGIEHAAPIVPLLADTGYRIGEVFRQPDLGATIAAVAAGGRDAFYRGPIAERIAAHIAAQGGVLDTDDLAAHRGAWTEPLEVLYRGTRVSTQPPVSMGILLLIALRLLDRSGADPAKLDAIALADLLVRIKHATFGHAMRELGDPESVGHDGGPLLGDDWIDHCLADLRAGAVEPTPTGPLVPTGSDTTSLAVVDSSGMAVSFIHSLFNEFGARELVPGTGIVLNDRLANLRVDPTHPNGLAPGKRPMHTLHGYVAQRADGTLITGATPGGRGQMQTNLQVLINVLHRGDDLQAAIDHPRWLSGMPRVSPEDDTLYLESTFAPDADRRLADLGHRVEVFFEDADDYFGSCTAVARSGDGEIVSAAADHRRSAQALAW